MDTEVDLQGIGWLTLEISTLCREERFHSPSKCQDYRRQISKPVSFVAETAKGLLMVVSKRWLEVRLESKFPSPLLTSV